MRHRQYYFSVSLDEVKYTDTCNPCMVQRARSSTDQGLSRVANGVGGVKIHKASNVFLDDTGRFTASSLPLPRVSSATHCQHMCRAFSCQSIHWSNQVTTPQTRQEAHRERTSHPGLRSQGFNATIMIVIDGAQA